MDRHKIPEVMLYPHTLATLIGVFLEQRVPTPHRERYISVFPVS